MQRAEFEPGAYVRLATRPEWGLGQVQTAVGQKVTVMFENAGKVVVDTAHARLDHAEI